MKFQDLTTDEAAAALLRKLDELQAERERREATKKKAPVNEERTRARLIQQGRNRQAPAPRG